MKALGFLALPASLVVFTAFGQGQITFGNHIPGVLDAPIYGVEFGPFGDWDNAKTGNTASGTPSGTQVYRGGLLEGWSVMFLAQRGVVETGWELLPAPVTVTLGSGAEAGYFPTTTVTFDWLHPTVQYVTAQIRVWDSLGGTRTWNEAFNLGGGGPATASALFTVEVGGTSTGFRSFNLGFIDNDTVAPYVVPEPTAVTLTGLSMAAALIVRWNWNRRA